MATMQAVALTPRFGVEVRGCRLDDLSDDDGRRLRQLLWEHSLLLVRGQALESGQHVDVLRKFGEPVDESSDGERVYFSIFANSADLIDDPPVYGKRDDALGAGLASRGDFYSECKLPFHNDYLWTKYPYPILSLQALECSDGSSPTFFANTVLNRLDLPADLVGQLATRHAVSAQKLDPGAMEERTRLADAGDDDTLAVYPRTEWPILVRHPMTGEQLVFTSEQMTSHVVGLDDESSEALLQRVFSHLYAANNLYVHRWEPGDLMVWDNLALHHSRNRTASGERRAHRRVAVGCGRTLVETVASARGDRAPELLGTGSPA